MAKDDGLDEALASSSAFAEELTFYNGEGTIYYNDALHAYYKIDDDGQKILVAGVTTVGAMKDKSGPLTQWAANETALAFIQQAGIDEVSRYQLNTLFQSLRNKETPETGLGSATVLFTIRELAELLNTARFNFRKLSEDATDIGKVAHDWLEGFINGVIANRKDTHRALPIHEEATVLELGSAEAAQKATNCISAILDWFSKHHVRFLHSELKLYSRVYDVCGTTDWVGYVTSCGDPACCQHEGTELMIVDFKSSRSLYEEYYMQVAAYMQMWNEEHPDQPVVGRLLIRMDKDGTGHETAYRGPETFDDDFNGFLGALALYVWDKQFEVDRKYKRALAALARDEEEAVRKAKWAATQAEWAVKREEKARVKAAKEAERIASGKPPRKPRASRVVIKEVDVMLTVPSGSPNDAPWEGEARFTPVAAAHSILDEIQSGSPI